MRRAARHVARRRAIVARCEQWWRLPQDAWIVVQDTAWRGPGSKRIREFQRWLRKQKDKALYIVFPVRP